MLQVLGWVMGVGFVLEFVLYFAAPWVFARLAFLPVKFEQRVALSPSAKDALMTVVPEPSGYREAPARRFDLTRSGLPHDMDYPDAVGRFYPGSGFVAVRLPYRVMNRTLAVARVDVRESGGVVSLSARYIPFTWPTMFVLLPTAGIAALVHGLDTAAMPGRFGIIAAVIAANIVFVPLHCRGRITRAVEIIAGAIERTLKQA